jgi:hypothetical protein
MGKGGSSSGTIDYPAYMKYLHAYCLGSSTDIGSGYAAAFTKPTNDIIELMNAAWSTGSPYASYVATDPDAIFFDAAKAITDYDDNNPYELLEDFVDWDVDSQFTTYAAETNPLTTAFSDSMDDELEEKVYPQILLGAADINATMSSTVNISKALVGATKTREVAKFDGQLKTDMILKRIQIKMEYRRLVNLISSENSRLYLAAKREEDDNNLEYAYRDIMFDMDIYKPLTQVLASISGANTPNSTSPPKTSILGGAISGAAAGALIGSQITTGTGGADAGTATIAGAVIGGTVGIASTL